MERMEHGGTQGTVGILERTRIGLFGIGLDTYWPQFPGLRERLAGYQKRIADRMAALGAEVIDIGLIDSPEKAEHAGESLRARGIEMVFLYVSTYALSSTVLPVARSVGCPILLLNIQPVARIDYASFNASGDRGTMTGEWLAHCQACSIPEIASVLGKAGIDYHVVTGFLDDEGTWREIEEWIDACRVRGVMRRNRLGILGRYYDGMLDVYTDVTAQLAAFGGSVQLIEIDELRELRRRVTREEAEAKIGEFRREFDVHPDCDAAELERAARTSVALDRLVAARGLGSLAYYYEGTPGGEHEDIVTSVIAGNSLLTARGVPVAGECEVKNAQAMKIMDSFGVGGSFSEFYAMDFPDDVLLLGHDGPAHFKIAEGRVGLVPLPVYHGKPGKGLSIQMTVHHGPVTLLSVCESRQGVHLLVAEGESVEGPVLEIGNTNSRYRFPIDIRTFIDRWAKAGPSHHCAIGIGGIAGKLEKLAALCSLGFVRVC